MCLLKWLAEAVGHCKRYFGILQLSGGFWWGCDLDKLWYFRNLPWLRGIAHPHHGHRMPSFPMLLPLGAFLEV